MIDYLGLIDPDAIAHVEDRDLAWWIGHYRPDYWVTFKNPDNPFDGPARATDEFRDHYRLVHEEKILAVYERDQSAE
jgi:hypothetical protein